MEEKNIDILSIDAWGDPDGCWTWNQWFKVGEISKEEFEKLSTTRSVLKWFRENGYLTERSVGKVGVDDDQYNLVIIDRRNKRPLFAIEYGRHY
jgi:hypothetical protein